MPNKKKPAYTLHKPTGQARVRIDGHDHYLGAYGSQKSRDEYDGLILEWLAQEGDVRKYTLTVDELAILFMDFARGYYRKNGKVTSEIACYRTALRPLIGLFGTTRVRDFGPRMLKKVRSEFVAAGHVRRTVNSMVTRIRRLFKWGVADQYVPPSVYQALCAVEGLKGGRCEAPESDPVEPVDQSTVDTTMKHLPTVVQAMVSLQLLTGARPGEITQLRPADITFGLDGVWTYRPQSHKTEHHDMERQIFIGSPPAVFRSCAGCVLLFTSRSNG
jgi:integrase